MNNGQHRYLLCSQGSCDYAAHNTEDGLVAMSRHHIQEHGSLCALIWANTTGSAWLTP